MRLGIGQKMKAVYHKVTFSGGAICMQQETIKETYRNQKLMMKVHLATKISLWSWNLKLAVN